LHCARVRPVLCCQFFGVNAQFGHAGLKLHVGGLQCSNLLGGEVARGKRPLHLVGCCLAHPERLANSLHGSPAKGAT
jgi:hypothetical protein